MTLGTVRWEFFPHPGKEDRHGNSLWAGFAYGDRAVSLMDEIPNRWLGVDSASGHTKFDSDERSRRYLQLAGTRWIKVDVRGSDHHVARQHCLERIHRKIHQDPPERRRIGCDPAKLGIQIGSKGNPVARYAAKKFLKFGDDRIGVTHSGWNSLKHLRENRNWLNGAELRRFRRQS